jgi:uncharacterized phage protein (TIGR02220 family)
MERTGWTKRHRKRWDKGYHTDLLLWVMMDYFIDHANFEDKEWFDGAQKITIKRGQCVFSQPTMAKFFKVGRRQIRTRLIVLENIGFSTIKTTKRYSIITICNYNRYQDCHHGERPSNRPTPDQHPTTPKEVKKLKNKDRAARVLTLLNDIAGRNFRCVDRNLEPISARIDEYSEADCETVVRGAWQDPKFDKSYFQPSTLFRPTNFENYINRYRNCGALPHADNWKEAH